MVGVEDGLGGALGLAGLAADGVDVVVVLGEGGDAGDVVGEAGDDVDPGLVVVHAHGDEEGLLALLGPEAQHPGGAAAAHAEGQGGGAGGRRAVPGPARRVVPAPALDEGEEGVGVGLVDADFDAVGHVG